MRCKYLALIVLFFVPALAISRSDAPSKTRDGSMICGTSASRHLNALAKAGYYESRTRMMERLGRLPLFQAQTPGVAADSGDIAVLEDDGLILVPLNPFNLASKAIRFEPGGAGGYSVAAGASTYDSTAGTPLALKDDDTAQVPLGFQFPFFGKAYDSIQVNSDGNLTFGQGDMESADREIGRFLFGPPRIAPFFADLNPEGTGKVSYRAVADGIVITWDSVPDYNSAASLNSFNVKLFKSGSIEFVYGTVASRSAVVGLAPGNNQEGVNAISYSSGLPTQVLRGAIAEVFSDTVDFSASSAARLFFKTHPDEFDQLVVFLGFDYTISGAFAYELNIKNEIQGLGLDQFDYTRGYGSQGRLRSFVLMGSLDGARRFPSDPNAYFFRTYNSLQVIAHEVAHRWLAHPLLQNGANKTLDLLHAADQAHWSFFFNADASVMEGNRIDDRGADSGNQRFITSEATNKYSALDRYLMGYGRKEDVSPMFFVQNPTGTPWTSDALPSTGITFGGTRRDFTVDSIVSANGARFPSILDSPKVHRQAFILLTKHGQQATPVQIAKLQAIRDAFVAYFNQQTGGLGYSVTNLQSAPGTTPAQIFFPYFQGNSSRYTGIAIANWGATPADVEFAAFDNAGNLLSTPARIINPRMITIPPGAQIAMLAEQIHGLSLDDPRNGWIQAHSSSSQVAGFFLDGNVSQSFLDGAVAGNQVYKNFYFTQTQMGTAVTQGSSFSNLINVVNPSAAAASLTLMLLDDQGALQGKATRTLPPLGRLAEDLSSLFPGIAKPRSKGYVSVTSDVAVVGYQAMDTGATVYSLPAQPASTATTLYAAQFASGRAGAQYFTDLNLINTSSQARHIQILLADNNGSKVSGISNPVPIDLQAGQQLRARGENLFNLPDPAAASGLIEGSLVITMDGPGVIGDVTFGDAVMQSFIASLPLDGNPVSNLVFSQVAQGFAGGTKPYFTGIAAYNPNSTAVSITIDVFSEQGTKTGTATFPLASGGRISKTLPQLVPAIKEQVRGYIRLTSSGGTVSAFELFGSQNLDFLTAVPAQPINP